MLSKVPGLARRLPGHFGCGPPGLERAVRRCRASYYASATLCDGWNLLESCPIAEASLYVNVCARAPAHSNPLPPYRYPPCVTGTCVCWHARSIALGSDRQQLWYETNVI